MPVQPAAALIPHELMITGVEPQTLKLHDATFCLTELVPDEENAAQAKGAAVGVAVGMTEGTAVGTADGKSVGEAVGTTEGERVPVAAQVILAASRLPVPTQGSPKTLLSAKILHVERPTQALCITDADVVAWQLELME